jgi:hypothetical protein
MLFRKRKQSRIKPIAFFIIIVELKTMKVSYQMLFLIPTKEASNQII